MCQILFRWKILSQLKILLLLLWDRDGLLPIYLAYVLPQFIWLDTVGNRMLQQGLMFYLLHVLIHHLPPMLLL